MPPLLLGAGALFWGWQSGLWIAGVLVAAALEAARHVRWRLDLARADFNRVSDLSSVLLVGAIVYLGGTVDPARALTTLFQWLPLVVLPLVLAQVYSTSAAVDARIFFWSQRAQGTEHDPHAPRLDLRFPYLVLCVISASAANQRTAGFYLGTAALIAWALWPARRRQGRAVVWLGAMALVLSLGWLLSLGIQQAQRALEGAALEWVADWIRRDVDPFRSTTALGAIGELKLSDRIVVRVRGERPDAVPPRLREGVYNAYHGGSWLALGSDLQTILPEGDGTTWRFGAPEGAQSAVEISAPLRRGRGVLPLPPGAVSLERLAVVRLGRTALGSVRAEEGLGLVTFTARSTALPVLDSGPGSADLGVPPNEALVLTEVVEELGLRGRPAPEVVAGLTAYFDHGFRYSTYLRGQGKEPSAIEGFLRVSRAGHCEYFATATALLLRAAGVPARYVTGYSVREWSPFERAWVIRTRHAHAWAEAWVNGAWREVDTTPPVWGEVEDATAPAWQRVADLWAWLTHELARWRYGERRGGVGWLAWLLIPLVALLVWRIYARRRVTRAPARPEATTLAPARPGTDSEFYRIESRLADLGAPRAPGETPRAWVARLAQTAVTLPGPLTALDHIADLHYRYRFDPAGITPDDRQQLASAVTAWLERETTTRR